MSPLSKPTRRSFLALTGVLALAACAGWQTAYAPIPDAARDFRLAGVSVSVPDTLSVSEDESVYVPQADILWIEDKPGDRRAQVASIFRDGIRAGARGLHGKTPVRIEATVVKFHALNRKARYSAPEGTGVYDIAFNVQIVDARTGTVLVPPQLIRADAPALTGPAAVRAEQEGSTQRKENVAQIAATVAGWLGLGPDNRTNFERMGG